MEYANFIAHCLEIARRGEYYVAPNPMVGAVLVRNSDEQILAEGWHQKYGEGHAEVNCFKHFEEQITNHKLQITNLKDCTLFVSLEPCSHYGKTPPCAKLIIEKGVGRVVVGMLDPNPLVAGKGVQMLRDAGIEVIVICHNRPVPDEMKAAAAREEVAIVTTPLSQFAASVALGELAASVR